MKYYVGITETLHKTVCVDAKDEKDAIEKTKKAYQEFDVVLNWDDVVDDSQKFELEQNQEDFRQNDEDDFCYIQHID